MLLQHLKVLFLESNLAYLKVAGQKLLFSEETHLLFVQGVDIVWLLVFEPSIGFVTLIKFFNISVGNWLKQKFEGV